MPRFAREKSETGVYHVMVRGINRQNIFHEGRDYRRYLETLEQTKELSKCEIYAYCLMTNHVHLVIKEVDEEIGQIMRRLGSRYATWYNSKYDRWGPVFQGRYKSEAIENDRYLLAAIRYVHNNPLKAGLVKWSEDYPWSSYNSYIRDKEVIPNLTSTAAVLELFSADRQTAVKLFQEFSEMDNQDVFLDIEEVARISDLELKNKIREILQGEPITTLHQMERRERDEVLRLAKEIKGSSIRQIARITGLGYNIVFRA